MLNTQEYIPDICWSSSESSDYENVSSNLFCDAMTLKSLNRKRKRKKSLNRNIPNLNVSIIKVPEVKKEINSLEKSPIFSSTCKINQCLQSPILKNLKNRLPSNKCGLDTDSSPVLKTLPTRQENNFHMKKKSPVLVLKHRSPSRSPKIKKKLFASENYDINETYTVESKNKYSIIKLNKFSCDDHKSKVSNAYQNNNCDTITNSKHQVQKSENKFITEIENKLNQIKSREESNNLHVDNTTFASHSFVNVLKPKTTIDLVKNVQLYFDSHFSSETASQQSISECESTPQNTSKFSDDVEIVSSMTQAKDSLQAVEDTISPLALNENYETNINCGKSKKVKYRKDGLAFRLSGLLKKQNAKISLWQHEKFLAQNSNFLIPKSEHIVFRIQKVNFKYGSYIIETMDLHDKRFLIFINGYYVKDSCNIVPDVILKIYEPYKILDLTNDCKLVVNVSKFECVPIVM
ncbi:unnamed protein product [Parnassius apollo]|uniref:(apollo) hypothetical protein n=1 Tax=Parnassius apollo TaxID=110799 RepID=A0A8S3XTJ4_PARAO|nr:unnamed protein product [Parnassius apollo]